MAYRGIQMKRLFLIALLVLTSEPVHAGWVEVEKQYQYSDLQTVYFDPETILREGDLVSMWELTDFRNVQGDTGGPHGFGPRHRGFGSPGGQWLSAEAHLQFDCADKRLRLLEFRKFSRQMGTGTQNDGYADQDRWFPVKPGSIDHALWEVACGRE